MAFDVITPVQMGRGSIGTSISTFHTVAANTRSLLKDIDIANNSTSPIDVTVYLVPSGDVAAAANILIPDIEIVGKGMFQWSGIQVLDAGDTIQAIASATGTSINISGGLAE
jgi:hypothetical protein